MKQWSNLLKGIGLSLIITIVALFIFSILLTYTSISETYMDVVIMIITGISILIGSFIGNIKLRKNGMLNGGIIGLIYVLLIYLVSSLLNWKFSLNVKSIIMIIVSLACGSLGGIFGVNKKYEAKKNKKSS